MQHIEKSNPCDKTLQDRASVLQCSYALETRLFCLVAQGMQAAEQHEVFETIDIGDA